MDKINIRIAIFIVLTALCHVFTFISISEEKKLTDQKVILLKESIEILHEQVEALIKVQMLQSELDTLKQQNQDQWGPMNPRSI